LHHTLSDALLLCLPFIPALSSPPAACIIGYGPFGPTGCSLCPPGTAKNRISPKECDFCLDGFIANAPEGATDCLDNTRRRRSRSLLESGSGEEESSSGPSEFEEDANRLCRHSLDTPAGFDAVYDSKINACTCPEGTKLQPVVPSINVKTGETEFTGPSCVLA
jgi:hypothetical protein